MVAAAAYAIGEQLHLRRLLGQQRAMLELIDEGVIFLDGRGFISAWNDKARAMLQAPSCAVGKICPASAS